MLTFSKLIFLFRNVYLEFFKKIGWRKVASLTQDGQQYSDYISELQDHLQAHDISFVINRKFPESAVNTPSGDMSKVGSRYFACTVVYTI